MPRRPRITLAGVPLHIIQRGNNRQACFYTDEDYQSYLGWLAECSRESKCAVHAYVLMTNHVYLLLTPGTAGQMMKRLGFTWQIRAPSKASRRVIAGLVRAPRPFRQLKSWSVPRFVCP